jgi:uncharacterized protein YjdB
MAACIRHGVTLAAIFALMACGDGDDYTLPQQPPALTVAPASITAMPGDTVRLRMTDDRGRPIRATLLGSSTGAATVDTAGLVTAVGPGTSVVTISVGIGAATVTASVPVTVLGLTLAPRQATIAVGATVALAPTLVGDSAAYGALRWTSSDTAVATVGADGRVVGVGCGGVARIGVVAARDPRLRAEATVTVVPVGTFMGPVTVTPTQVTLRPGATQQLSASATFNPCGTPPAGTSREVTFTSSDTTVATVSPTGLISARRIGAAVVTVAAVAAPGVTQAVTVTVRDGAARLAR